MKRILLMICLLILLTGCKAIDKTDNYDYKEMMNKILSFNINYHNKVGNGYKYYAPKGVVKTYSNNYNDILKRKNNTYYLYIDVVSYYYKSDVEYKIDDSVYYSSLINKGDKKGYVEIRKKNNDELYIQMFYNYAKIESYIDKKDLKTTITDISYILSSIEFNDSLLKKMYESGNLDSKDEVYKLFDNKEKEGNFIEYIKEYDKYDGSEEVNEELIIENSTVQKKTTTTKKEQEVKTTTNSVSLDE